MGKVAQLMRDGARQTVPKNLVSVLRLKGGESVMWTDQVRRHLSNLGVKGWKLRDKGTEMTRKA